MKCSNCSTEMMDGFAFALRNGVTIRPGYDEEETRPTPEVFICPNCGKVELYMDLKRLQPKSLSAAVKRWFKGYDTDPE